jgi:hypothetical protein
MTTNNNHDTLTLNGVEYVRKDSVQKNTDTTNYCIVRCRNAGVHAGVLASRKDGVVTLHNSRRLWRWWSAATLSELALEGPLRSKLNEQKYGAPLPVLYLTESDVCEVIPCTKGAAELIQAISEWRNK